MIGTGDISLQDVTSEIYGIGVISGNLSQCFTDANGVFNATYQPNSYGSKNNLGNFKGYNHRLHYGFLYNARCVNTGKLAPTGWEVPHDFDTLIAYVGGISVAGALKSQGTTIWTSPNVGTTDAYGFSIQPSGVRTGFYDGYGTDFVSMGNLGSLWTSDNSNTPYNRYLYAYNEYIYGVSYLSVINYGMSVRCRKTDPTGWTAGDTVTDIDGNVYRTVKIGTEVWMQENLRTTHFNDGGSIPEVTDYLTWINLTTPALCAYDNNHYNL